MVVFDIFLIVILIYSIMYSMCSRIYSCYVTCEIICYICAGLVWSRIPSHSTDCKLIPA